MERQPLWDAQEIAAAIIAERRRVILGDVMGLGKTRTSLAAVDRNDCRRILSLAFANSAVATMYQESAEWLGYPAAVAEGDASDRAKIWKNSPFVTSNLATFLTDMRNGRVPLKWDAIIVDECDRVGLSNRDTALFKLLKSTLEYDMFIPMSGSIVRKGPQDLWPMLHLIDKKKFSSYWQYVMKYCYVEDGVFGKEIFGATRDPKMRQELKDLLTHYLIRRTKAEARPGMPEKIRQPFWCEMDPWQRKTHDDLFEHLIAERQDGSHIYSPTSLEKVIKLRQLLVCPKLLDPSAGDGGAIEGIIDQLKGLPRDEQHCAIWTPFRAAIPYVQDALRRAGIGPVVVFEGGLSVAELLARVALVKERRGVALCVIAYSQSFSIETANKGFMLGFEWDFEANKQAEDRIHRGTSTETVNIYYCRHKNSIEDRIAEVNNNNQYNVNTFMPRDAKEITL